MNDKVAPFGQFGDWIKHAENLEGNQPSAMTLSTVSANHRPSSRIVLMKHWDKTGITFFTNFESRKAKELTENPHASLLFFWDSLRRQIRIEGKVTRISETDSKKYFQSRPIESQWGAWASKQSSELVSRDELIGRFEKYKKKYPDQVPLPEFWGGYRLEPDYFEFWQTGDYRLHQREVFEKKGHIWIKKILYP